MAAAATSGEGGAGGAAAAPNSRSAREVAANSQATKFLALRAVPARGALSATERASRLMGLRVNDRFTSIEEVRALERRAGAEAVMARYKHELETYSTGATPDFVKRVFTEIEGVISQAFDNVERAIRRESFIDLSRSFENLRRMAIEIKENPRDPQLRGWPERTRVSEELWAFVRWFEGKYNATIEENRSARSATTSALRRELETLTPSSLDPNFAARVAGLRTRRGGARRNRKATRRNRKATRRNRKATRRNRKATRRNRTQRRHRRN